EAAIRLLHVLNFISAHAWSRPVRKRGTLTVVCVAASRERRSDREKLNFCKSQLLGNFWEAKLGCERR
ncbi:MAG: hypothetical protein VKJ24_10045, partial [Synechococcales bacterium]|nr:hypothetical protein [Synechococcales bacterium]